MKSPARLGEMAPRTFTPSTGVPIRSAGRPLGVGRGRHLVHAHEADIR